VVLTSAYQGAILPIVCITHILAEASSRVHEGPPYTLLIRGTPGQSAFGEVMSQIGLTAIAIKVLK
jgi:hypothetical protein